TVQAAGGKVTVAAKEYSFAPSAIAAKAGKLHLTLENKGAMAHELIVLKTSAAPGSLKVGASGRVSEKSSVGEVSTITAGATKTTTLDLKPGKYTFVCNIPGHYKDGMYGQLTVH
ncbi:MAG: plastocyanin/azurin family copper-binding protein, partial [Solirubrobacteraceae bacterium]